MTLEYAENRIKEALKLSKGNTAKARQQIIAWTFEDAKLLHALTKPHLTGIVAYNVERVMSGRADAQRARKTQPQAKKPPSKKPANAPKAKEEEAFGLQILKAAGAATPMFGFEDAGTSKSGRVSQNHINAIRAIAAKHKSDPTD